MQTLQEKKIVSENKSLFIFNPEHDLALAVGNGPYTPPAQIIKLKNHLTLLPAILADNSDFILIPDCLSINEISHLPYFSIVSEKELKLVRGKDLEPISGEIEKVHPWGWDHAVYNFLIENKIPVSLLPTSPELDNIRNLSHRRTCIPFRETIAEILGEPLANPATELCTVEDVEDYLNNIPVAYFKAPWSSSGRGIVLSNHISRKGLLEWAHGCIKKQGSVLAEPAWARIFDFATEWEIKEGKVYFLGYSVFNTSSRGKYHGNVKAHQEELIDQIKKFSPNFSYDIVKAQSLALSKHISPYYEGPLGIDMLIDKDGKINSCVEINLRYTMGHIFLYGNSQKSINFVNK